MFTTTQMIIVVVFVLLSGAIAGSVFYLLEGKNKYSKFPIIDFSDNFVAPRMQNTHISIDDVVKNFKLLDWAMLKNEKWIIWYNIVKFQGNYI